MEQSIYAICVIMGGILAFLLIGLTIDYINNKIQNRMNTVISVPPAQMVVNIDDLSVVNDIRRALRLMHGVGRITLKKNSVPTHDITQTAGYKEAHEDIQRGRVYNAANVEDMFNQILGA